jgi:hypothetical protein
MDATLVSRVKKRSPNASLVMYPYAVILYLQQKKEKIATDWHVEWL